MNEFGVLGLRMIKCGGCFPPLFPLRESVCWTSPSLMTRASLCPGSYESSSSSSRLRTVTVMPPSSTIGPQVHEPTTRRQGHLVSNDDGATSHCLAAACHSVGFDLAEIWRLNNGSPHASSNNFSLIKSWEEKPPRRQHHPQEATTTTTTSSSSLATRTQSARMCSKGSKEKVTVWLSDKCPLEDTMLRTAVAMPVYDFEEQEEYCVLFFAMERIESSPQKVTLLQLLAKAAVMTTCDSQQLPPMPPKPAHPHSSSTTTSSQPPRPAAPLPPPLPAATTTYKHSAGPSDLEAEMAAMLAGLGPEKGGLVEWSDLTDLKLLSETGTSSIFTARLGKERVIAKTMKKECYRMEMENEIDLMAQLNHYHIASFVGACGDPGGRRAIVMELCDGGGLDHRLGFAPPLQTMSRSHNNINYKKPFSYPELLRYAHQLADTLRYLHDEAIPGCSVVHRDLKPDNICFLSDGTLKLIDFGVAKVIPNSTKDHEKYSMTTGTGSMRYMAPEVALGSSYNEKVDVYSFAFVLWAMATMKKPFENCNQSEFVRRVIRGGCRPPLKSKWPKRFRSLLEACWHADPDKRPSFKRVVDALESLQGDVDAEPSKPPSRWSLLINRHTCHF